VLKAARWWYIHGKGAARIPAFDGLSSGRGTSRPTRPATLSASTVPGTSSRSASLTNPTNSGNRESVFVRRRRVLNRRSRRELDSVNTMATTSTSSVLPTSRDRHREADEMNSTRSNGGSTSSSPASTTRRPAKSSRWLDVHGLDYSSGIRSSSASIRSEPGTGSTWQPVRPPSRRAPASGSGAPTIETVPECENFDRATTEQ